MQKVYYTVLHVIYILIAMIVAAFLQAPFLTRAAIMGIVPVNLGTYLKHGMEASLNFTSMTVLILLITGSECANQIICKIGIVTRINKYRMMRQHYHEICEFFARILYLCPMHWFLFNTVHFVMVGIQRIFGPNNSTIKPINLTYQNGHSNRNVHEYTSSSYSNSMPKAPLHIKLMQRLQELYSLILSKINYCIRTFSIYQVSDHYKFFFLFFFRKIK